MDEITALLNTNEDRLRLYNDNIYLNIGDKPSLKNYSLPVICLS